MACAMVKVLPEPVTPRRTWSRRSGADAFDQFTDRLGLIARGLEVRDQLERDARLRPIGGVMLQFRVLGERL